MYKINEIEMNLTDYKFMIYSTLCVTIIKKLVFKFLYLFKTWIQIYIIFPDSTHVVI